MCAESLTDQHTIYTVQVRLAHQSAPLGRALGSADLVLVEWTVDAPEIDRAILAQQGKIALRRHRIMRLIQETADQQATPTDADLARALKVCLRTIHSDIKALKQAGITVTTRRRASEAHTSPT